MDPTPSPAPALEMGSEHGQQGARTASPNRSMRRLRSAECSAAAVALRRDALSYPQIAQRLGISLSTAFRYVDAHLRKVAERASEDASQARVLELTRLDAHLARVVAALDAQMPAAAAGDAEAANVLGRLTDVATRLSDRRSKLLGLDAPARSEVKGDLTIDPATVTPAMVRAFVEEEFGRNTPEKTPLEVREAMRRLCNGEAVAELEVDNA